MISAARRQNAIRMDRSEKTVKLLSYCLLILALVVTLFPMLNLVAKSISGQRYVAAGKITIIPHDISFGAYRYVLTASRFWLAMKNTLFVTIMGTLISVAVCTLAGYALSKQRLPGRRWLMLMFMFAMLFSGGMIPTYLLIKELGLLNSLWSMILPGAFSTYNMLLLKNYFEGLPAEIEESAHIDGANYVQIFLRIALPLATPVLATITLFCIVSGWNAYFSAKLYITKQELLTLQAYLAGIIFESADPTGSFQLSANNASGLAKQSVVDATVVCTMLPVVVFYSFLQRFLVSGMVLGSVKG